MDVLTNFIVVIISQCTVYTCIKSSHRRDFPGGPVVRTPRFHCRGSGFNPWSGELRSRKPTGMAKKERNKIITLCTLNLHNVICQLYLNKRGKNYCTKATPVTFSCNDIRWFYNLDNVGFIFERGLLCRCDGNLWKGAAFFFFFFF